MRPTFAALTKNSTKRVCMGENPYYRICGAPDFCLPPSTLVTPKTAKDGGQEGLFWIPPQVTEVNHGGVWNDKGHESITRHVSQPPESRLRSLSRTSDDEGLAPSLPLTSLVQARQCLF